MAERIWREGARNFATRVQIMKVLCRKALQTKSPEDEEKAFAALKQILEEAKEHGW